MAFNAFVRGQQDDDARLEAAYLVLLNDDGHFASIQFDQAANRIEANALDKLVDDGLAKLGAAHLDQRFKGFCDEMVGP